jgi:asparagine synthase (glutamine-hydrolysing)
MTAIGGFISFDNDIPGIEVATILDAQRLYGQGPSAIVSGPGHGFGVASCLGLAPIDTDRALLLGDARFDNRQDLLGCLGIPYRTPGLADIELLGFLWERFGPESLEMLIGDFAIAAFCGADRKLILCRDTTGQRPLFFAQRGNAVVFASMPSGILAVEGWHRGFDQASLSRALLDIPLESAATCFAGIKRVPPGCAVVFTDVSTTTQPLWTPNYDELRLANDSDYAEQYRSLLNLAVEARMRRPDGGVASHLSSGFDTSAVATTAARLMDPGDHLTAVTAAPPQGFFIHPPRGRFADESAVAARTAAACNMRHIVVRSSGSLAERIRSQAQVYQDPVRNLINAGWLQATETAARDAGASVLLCADLGNLTINAGGLRVLADIRRRNGLAPWWKEARLVARRQDVRWRGILFNSFAPSLPDWLRLGLIDVFQDSKDRADLTFLRHEHSAMIDRGEKDMFRPSGDTYRDRWRYLGMLDYGTNRKGSAAESGIETRDPLSDRRLIDFSLRLPRNQLLANGESRPLAKRALADRVPPEVLHLRKRGYQSADWFNQLDRNAFAEMIEEIAPCHSVQELVDIPRLKQVIADWPKISEHRLSTYESLAVYVPLALCTGLFMLEFDQQRIAAHRQVARHAPAAIRPPL